MLPPLVEVAGFRIGQFTVTNAERAARAMTAVLLAA
jgi:hypothetical protein